MSNNIHKMITNPKIWTIRQIHKHQSNVENFVFHDHVDQSKYAQKLSYVNENVILFFAQILIGFWRYKQAKKKNQTSFEKSFLDGY